jgi:hypothetical protein
MSDGFGMILYVSKSYCLTRHAKLPILLVSCPATIHLRSHYGTYTASDMSCYDTSTVSLWYLYC